MVQETVFPQCLSIGSRALFVVQTRHILAKAFSISTTITLWSGIAADKVFIPQLDHGKAGM